MIDPDTHRRACTLVLARLETTLVSVIQAGPLSSTVDDLIAGIRRTFDDNEPHNVVSVQVPLAFEPEIDALDAESDLVGVAAACTALYVGARLLDDLMDGHDVSYFESEQSAMDVLGWATFLSIVPPLVLSRMRADSMVRVAIIEDLSAGMAAMAAGQLGDVTAAGALPTTTEAMASIRGKTGALLATFARCAARAAQLTPEAIEQADRYGNSLGVARQIIADVAKVGRRDERRADRMSPTYLTALHAETLPADDEFTELVVRARTDLHARADLVDQLGASPVLSRAVFAAEIEFANAIAAVDSMGISQSNASRLIDLVEASSSLGGPTE